MVLQKLFVMEEGHCRMNIVHSGQMYFPGSLLYLYLSHKQVNFFLILEALECLGYKYYIKQK